MTNSIFGKISGTAQDAKSRAAADAAQRKNAGNHPGSIILNAKDLTGEYDVYRLLHTTLGGISRALTHDDLRAFQHNVRTVKSQFKAGIRARQVLDLSSGSSPAGLTKTDKQRANEEIHMAVPVSAYGGKVRFMTNAGPNSDVKHHHVMVDFMSFSATVSAGLEDSKKTANKLRKEPLKIECTCGKWRFWYRYIASIGGYNAGRAETGYPKIRNPGLKGVACKHILRVMAEVESSPSVMTFLAKLIEKARAQDDNKVNVRNTQKEADALAAEQQANGRNVGDTTTRREKQRAAAQARRDNAKKRRDESRKHQKDGAATRQAKFADQAVKAEEVYVQRAMKRAEQYGFKMTDEQVQATRKKYRRDHAQ